MKKVYGNGYWETANCNFILIIFVLFLNKKKIKKNIIFFLEMKNKDVLIIKIFFLIWWVEIV